MDITALPTRYDVGKASVDAGGTVVTPTGASWYGNAWDNDLFFLPSQPLVPPQRIASANVDGTLTLAFPWPGAAAVGEAYEIRYVGIIERSTAQSRKVLEQLGDVKAFFDIQVNDTAARLALETPDRPLRAGYRVLVSNVGDGTAAIYSKASGAYDDWTDPAPYSGPAVTLDVTDVETVPFGVPPDVMLTPVTGGYHMSFDIPAGMIVEPGTITTLAPDQPATWDWEPITGGYRVHLSIPRGPTGDINGVTPFWNMRLGSDADAGQARKGLRVPVGEYRNLLINPLYDLNQRVVSGTVVLASGQYGHDRWRAGSSGCTYTFAVNNGVTTVNITSGTLQQPIEAGAFAGRSGEYVLSWVGTAQARVNGGAYGTSGNVAATCDGNATVTVEFATGTVSLPQFERDYTTEFSARHPAQELEICQRYYEKSYDLNARPGSVSADNAESYASSGVTFDWNSGVSYSRKRVVPQVTVYSPNNGAAGFVYNGSAASNMAATLSNIGTTRLRGVVLSSAPALGAGMLFHWVAEAELS